MSKYLTANDFITGISGTSEDYEIPNVGVIQIRSLNVMDVRKIEKEANSDPMTMGLMMVIAGVVEPKLTSDHLTNLEKAHPGIIGSISKRISVLSGLSDDVEKKVGTGS